MRKNVLTAVCLFLGTPPSRASATRRSSPSGWRASMAEREIETLLDRGTKLIALIEERIAADGESAILFDME